MWRLVCEQTGRTAMNEREKMTRAKHLIEQIEVCDKLFIVLFDVFEPI